MQDFDIANGARAVVLRLVIVGACGDEGHNVFDVDVLDDGVEVDLGFVGGEDLGVLVGRQDGVGDLVGEEWDFVWRLVSSYHA